MAPVLRRFRPHLTLKIQKADHYKSRTDIEMRSGQYAAPRQDADTGGTQEFIPGLLPEAQTPGLDTRRSRFGGYYHPLKRLV